MYIINHLLLHVQLQGDSREYANVGQMNTPLPCAQYNGLMRKSATLMNRKVKFVNVLSVCTLSLFKL